jgi:two-component system OmpR family response regulator
MESTDHILVVDDDAEIRTLLTRYLEKNGPARHRRGRRPRDVAARWPRPFDLVVLDLMLPGDDGLTLCRHAARQARCRC